MIDSVTPEIRSRMMAAIRGRDTKPELAIRKALHALGFRYSLHSTKIPGKPDLVLAKYRAVIWIHGCYWHGHDCGAVKLPSSNEGYWHPKIERTRVRDKLNTAAIDARGWRSLTVWECCLRGKHAPGLNRVTGLAASWIRNGDQTTEFRGDSISLSL